MKQAADDTQTITYEAILRQIGEGVIVTDIVGTITFVNEAAARIHGVACLAVRPSAYSKIYHLFREDGRPYPSCDLPLARAVRGETVTNARWRIRRPDGNEVLAIGTAQPLHSADGRRIGAILTLRDASEVETLQQTVRDTQAALAASERRLAAQDG